MIYYLLYHFQFSTMVNKIKIITHLKKSLDDKNYKIYKKKYNFNY